MPEETWFKLLYHFSGLVATMLFLVLAFTLRKENKERVKSFIFLNYDKFRAAFYIMAFGATMFLIGNITAVYDSTRFHWVHEMTETIYNISTMCFAILLLIILKPRFKTERKIQNA